MLLSVGFSWMDGARNHFVELDSGRNHVLYFCIACFSMMMLYTYDHIKWCCAANTRLPAQVYTFESHDGMRHWWLCFLAEDLEGKPNGDHMRGLPVNAECRELLTGQAAGCIERC